MDKRNKRNKCDEILIGGGVEQYKQEISDRISEIKELWILREILKFIINMTKEG